MTDPLDQQVVDWLKTTLAQINEASGFRTTVPANRIRTDQTQLPRDDDFLVFIEDDEEAVQQTVTHSRAADLSIRMTVVIPASDANGESTNPRKQMRAFFADVRKVLAPFGENLDGASGVPSGVSAIELVGRSISLGEPGAKSIEGEFRLAVKLKEKHDA